MLTNKSICPICETTTTIEDVSESDSYIIGCPRCGEFELSDSAVTMFQRSSIENKQLSLGYWIKKNQSQDSKPQISEDLMRKLLVTFIPLSPKEQANNLLIWMAKHVKGFPQTLISEPLNNLISVIGTTNIEGVKYIVKYLDEVGLIRHYGYVIATIDDVFVEDSNKLYAKITFDGWERFDELQHSNKDSRLAFMAMQFGNATLIKIFNEVIKKAVSETGYNIRKLDDEKRAGSIDDKLRVEIRRSKFLISDLTDDNNGAYWEAGFAEGLGMPVIYICEESKFKDKKTHFDTNHHLTIMWKNDEESLKKFAEELKATIRETFPGEAVMED